jgi:hypothetical protein
MGSTVKLDAAPATVVSQYGKLPAGWSKDTVSSMVRFVTESRSPDTL